MFLASVCCEDDKQKHHGRIFACPLANQKVTEPFEILEKDGEPLMFGHENIELYFVNETTAIVTGYKLIDIFEEIEYEVEEEQSPKSEAPKEDGVQPEPQPKKKEIKIEKVDESMNLMVYLVDFREGLWNAEIFACKKFELDK